MEEWVKVKRLGAVNMGKVSGAAMGLFGLVYGVIYFLMMSALGSYFGGGVGGGIMAGLGILALIAFPVIFAVLGFVGGVISAALYNFVFARVDGIHLLIDFPQETKK